MRTTRTLVSIFLTCVIDGSAAGKGAFLVRDCVTRCVLQSIMAIAYLVERIPARWACSAPNPHFWMRRSAHEAGDSLSILYPVSWLSWGLKLETRRDPGGKIWMYAESCYLSLIVNFTIHLYPLCLESSPLFLRIRLNMYALLFHALSSVRVLLTFALYMSSNPSWTYSEFKIYPLSLGRIHFPSSPGIWYHAIRRLPFKFRLDYLKSMFHSIAKT